MSPNISIRDSIRWLPDEADEPTSTLVLTSGENRFVDIRILKGSENETKSNLPVPLLSGLDWAFAGFSHSELQHDDNGKPYAHSTWQHWVSDRARNVDEVKDEGDMFEMPDGRTLEKGRMVNPATGQETDYEEVWRDGVAKVVPEDESDGADDREEGEAGKKKCVVLMLHDDEHEARGMVVRMGQFVQGVLRAGSHFSLERWEWMGTAQKEGWQRVVRMGDSWMPCGAATEQRRLALGSEIRFGEYVWKVVELADF
ncbi:hypothetical protein LTR78_000972 [Recurvomyces mirabilis]|uniref:Protein HRI1 n=1 Tax=Recurvomyces mirabilis TaxID=574656 RepID=A0AAE0WW30_9PEZI|nr:hypothetical protein LTR78_000972 [Recurvomyces mirabilis]KAK5158944.1 hypothetical protein LTS14_003052 [Recurvomyces mirabilis]